MNTEIHNIYSNITNAVNFQTKNSPAFDQLITFQKSIIKDLILPNPYEACTPDFIDNFSVKLIKNILNSAVSDPVLVNTFSTILENYIQIIIYIFEQPNLAFLEAATQITNPNNIFYTTLSKNNLPPIQYTKITNLLKTNNFYQQIIGFFESHNTLTLKHISILINLLVSVKENSENYNKCICFICQKAISIFQSFDYDDIRDVDDRVLNSTLDSISSIESKYLNSDCALNFQLLINIRFAKSDILEKRFNGINQIVSIIKKETNRTQNKICQIVNEQQILDGILNDFHNQLVNPFVSILTQFILNKINIQNYLIDFWKISINQSSSVASEFFAGWKNLISNQQVKQIIFSQYSQALFEVMTASLTLPEASGNEALLSFLCEIATFANEAQKEQIFNSLLSLSSIPNSNLNLIANAIPLFMPKNSEQMREKIMKQTLEMVEHNYHISLAFTLFSNLKLNAEQSNQYLNSLLGVLNVNNSIEVIPLLFKLLKQHVRMLEDSQFQKIFDIYLPQLEKPDVFNFFINTISTSNAGKCVYSSEMKKKLFISVCGFQAFNDNLLPLTILLFDSINMTNKKISSKKGIDKLWEIAFRTGNQSIMDFIKGHISTMQYVEKCMNNIQYPGALECLYKIINKIEPSMNNYIRWILKMPLINEYIDEDALFPVDLIGSIEMTLMLSYGTTFAALKFFLSLFLNINKYKIIMYVNGVSISKFDTTINGPLKIDVKLTDRNDKLNFDYPTEIPSLILHSNATYTLNLMNILEDEQYGKTVLKILNKMPTLPNFMITFDIDEENNQIDESNDFSKYQWDWNKFLSFDEPNHLIYHLNTIGNNLNHNDIEWTRWFFNTGGAFKLFDLLLKTKDSQFDLLLLEPNQKKFNEEDYLLLLFIINKTLSLKLIDEINDIIMKIDDNILTGFLNYSLNIISNDDLDNVSYYLLEIIEKITIIRGINDSNEIINSYIELFEISCFHKNKRIRVLATDFIHKKEINSHNIMIKLLPKAISKNNSEFINSIISLVNESNDQNIKELIWNTLLDSTFNYFSMLKNRDVKGIWQNLNTAYPQNDFLQDLLSSFIILINSFEKNNNANKIDIPRIDELYFFLFDNILYNQMIYFKITTKMIALLNMIIHNKPSVVQDSIPRIKKIQEEMATVKINNNFNNKYSPNITMIENNLNNGPESHIKGLRNLGATCYMGSLLQQLYSIPIFRSSLLNLDLGNQEEEKQNDEKDSNIVDIYANNKACSSQINTDENNNQINTNENNNDQINTNENNNDQINPNENNNQINTNENNNQINTNENNNQINTNENNNQINTNENNNQINKINNSIENNPDSNNNQVTKDVKKDDYKWLFELQYLFLKMLIYPTSSSSIDPSNFVHEWKGWDGNPINPHQQQDAEEYFALLLSRLEPKLPTVDFLFKGKITNHLQGQGKFITYNKYTEEDYFDISLEVKGHKNIESSFEAYKSPDRFGGSNQYVTDDLGPIDAIQTHLIHQQSPILVIALKRFQFNMTTFIKEKLNSKYEFPLSLDISPILVSKNDTSNNDNNNNNNNNGDVSSIYELYGVVLHKGTADAGHYISHIKGSDNNWRFFNDAQVQVETVKEMFDACYGGSEASASINDEAAFLIDNGNAYILFYRRVDFDFNRKSGFDEGDLPVSTRLISRLADDIKKDILTEISASEEYFKFISMIIQDPEFLLSLLDSKSGVSQKCRNIIMTSCLNKFKQTNENLSDPKQFAQSVLFYYSGKASDFIGNSTSEVTQDLITNSSLITLVKEALTTPLISTESRDFIIGLVSKINEIEPIDPKNTTKEYIASIDRKLNIYANNLLLFYEIVRSKDTQIDTSGMVTILVDYLTKNKGRDTGSIVNLLIKMDSNNRQRNNNISNFFSDDMLLNYFLTDETKEILTLTVKRIKDDNSKLDLLFSLGQNELSSPLILSKLFICILSSKALRPQSKLKMIGIEGKNYMEIFFSEIIRQLTKEKISQMLEHINSFIPNFVEDTFETFIIYSDILVEKLILSLAFDVRRNACSLFLKYICINESNLHLNQGQTKSRSLFNIYQSLLKRLNFLQTSVLRLFDDKRNTFSFLTHSLQVEHYFYLLTQVVNFGKLNENAAQIGANLANFLEKASIPFEQFHEPCFIRKFVLDFITATLKKENSIEFFGFQGQILVMFMEAMPFFSNSSSFNSDQMNELETYAETYIKFITIIPAQLFHFIANSNFLFEILKSKKYMQHQLAKNLYRYICYDYLDYHAFHDINYVSNFANIFFSGCLNCHLEAGRVVPIKIAIYIMKKNPELSNFFYNDNLYSNVWDFISLKISQYITERNRSKMPIDTSVFPLMNLFGVFLTQFSSVPSNKVERFFVSSYYQSISSYVEKRLPDPLRILQFSTLSSSSPKDYSVNSKGSFVFLNSLFNLKLSRNIFEQIYEVILPFLSTENGFIAHVPMKAKCEAVNFMLNILKWAKNSSNMLKIGNFSNRIFNELANYIISVFQRDAFETSTGIDEVTLKKEKKIDREVMNVLAKESFNYYKYINSQSINKLFDAFRSMILYCEGAYYFNSNEMVNLCISIMKKMNYIPMEWIQNSQLYILSIIKNDYANSIDDFINAASIVDDVMRHFNISEVPKIDIDQQSKDNIDKWAKRAQEGNSQNDYFVAMHLFTILVSK